MHALQNGLNNEKLQQSNRSLVLGIIVTEGVISRTELVDLTGLGKPAITNIANELLEAGIIEECDQPRREGRRKTRGLTLKAGPVKILSARWMRERFCAAVYTLSGEFLYEEECPVDPGEDIGMAKERILSMLRTIFCRYEEREFLGICVGVPGPYIKDGNTSRALVFGYEKLQEVEIQQLFESEFHCPVITEHDAHLSAFCEWRSLPPDERMTCRCMLGLQSIGIGIGAGIILDGRILEGAFGVAGELGQIGVYFNGPANRYGERGLLEHYASSASVRFYVRQRLCEFPETDLSEESTYEEILSAYGNGDPLAEWAFDILAWRLAYGLVNAVFLINPQLIVIGPDYPVSERFIGKVKAALDGMLSPEIASRLSVRFSTIAEDTTLKGGSFLMVHRFIENATLYDRVREIMEQFGE